MDVRCERCQTEYEIEDARISDLGTEVQCGDCGHLFTVKRLAMQAPPPAPASADGWTDGTWRLVTRLGQTLELTDLSRLHTWIIERRVTREDRISRDGQSWQTLGQVGELAAFFDIVDSAERARTIQALESPKRLVPLQPPILIPPAQGREQKKAERSVVGLSMPSASFAPGGRAADSMGALPQAVDIGETETIRAERSRSHLLLKLALMVVVASGIGYGGICWQRRSLGPAVISSSGAAAHVDPQAASAAPATAPLAPAPAVAEAGADRGDEEKPEKVEQADSAGAGGDQASQSLAAQGYAALGHHQYVQAIKLFHKELARSPINGTALFGLAEAYRGAGRRQHALGAYQRYLEILPHGPNAGSARFQIRSLEAKMR